MPRDPSMRETAPDARFDPRTSLNRTPPLVKWAVGIFSATIAVVGPTVAYLRSTEVEAKPSAQAPAPVPTPAPSIDPAAFVTLQGKVDRLSEIGGKLEQWGAKLDKLEQVGAKLDKLDARIDKLDDRVRDVQIDVGALKARSRR